MTNHSIAGLAVASSGGHHGGRGIGIIVLVVIIAVAAYFVVRWARARRNDSRGSSGKGAN